MNSHDKSKPADILQVEVNQHGNDFIIGDLHGNCNCLRAMIAKLGEHDRLFIAGDMVDRGEESAEVIALIKEINERSPGKIYAIRGNHEEMTIQTINSLMYLHKGYGDQFIEDDMIEKYDKKANSHLDSIKHHIMQNGGEWISNLYLQELAEKKIKLVKGQIVFSKDSKMKLVLESMSSMPYIIHTNGNDAVKPFNIVHADMPISDEAIENRLAMNAPTLTESEKEHALWARNAEMKQIEVRDEHSDIAYCGHNILENSVNMAVRKKTNSVNVDGAAFQMQYSIIVNHTRGEAEFVKAIDADKKINSNDPAYLNKLKFLFTQVEDINNHLMQQKYEMEVSDDQESIEDLTEAAEEHLLDWFEAIADENFGLNDVISRAYEDLNSDIELINKAMDQAQMSEEKFVKQSVIGMYKKLLEWAKENDVSPEKIQSAVNNYMVNQHQELLENTKGSDISDIAKSIIGLDQEINAMAKLYSNLWPDADPIQAQYAKMAISVVVSEHKLTPEAASSLSKIINSDLVKVSKGGMYKPAVKPEQPSLTEEVRKAHTKDRNIQG